MADNTLTETQRRYYLDAMGIQCWQVLDQQRPDPAVVEVASIEVKQLAENSVDYNVEKKSAVAAISQPLNWSQLETSIQTCTDCDLHKKRKQAIADRGNQSADLMFVTLSPSVNDDAEGMLCSGEEDILLTKMLAAINIAIADVYITSLLKCSPAASHTISVNEISQCNVHLKQQIQMVKPKVLIVLGEIAAQCMLKQNTALDTLRDNINMANANNAEMKKSFESIPLLVSYSPAELLQKAENKRKAWSDLQQLQKLLSRI